MSGVQLEVLLSERSVDNQLTDQVWTGDEAVGILVLTEKRDKHLMTNAIRYVTPEAREAVLKTPMELGMAMSYDQLEQVLQILK